MNRFASVIRPRSLAVVALAAAALLAGRAVVERGSQTGSAAASGSAAATGIIPAQASPGVCSAGTPGAPPAAALRVGIDPETGQLGMPTPEQVRALEQLQGIDKPGALQNSSDGLQVVRHTDGRLSVDLQGRFQSYSVAKIGPDGELHLQCVEGEDAAQQALRAPVPAAGSAPRAPVPGSNASGVVK